MTYLERINNFPPILVRLLARKRYGPPLTTEEISDRTRNPNAQCQYFLSPAEIEEISKCIDWTRISLLSSLSFQLGCGIEFHDNTAMRRVNDYLTRKPTFRYLRASPLWKSYYLPLLIRWRKSYPADLKQLPPNHLAPHMLAILRRPSFRYLAKQP